MDDILVYMRPVTAARVKSKKQAGSSKGVLLKIYILLLKRIKLGRDEHNMSTSVTARTRCTDL